MYSTVVLLPKIMSICDDFSWLYLKIFALLHINKQFLCEIPELHKFSSAVKSIIAINRI